MCGDMNTNGTSNDLSNSVVRPTADLLRHPEAILANAIYLSHRMPVPTNTSAIILIAAYIAYIEVPASNRAANTAH